MTVAELDRRAIQARWGEKRREWLRLYLEPFVKMPYDRALCRVWAEVMARTQALRNPSHHTIAVTTWAFPD